MLLLNKQEIQSVFTMTDAIAATRRAFEIVAEGSYDAPLRTVIDAPKEEGSFLFMPAYISKMDTAALKVISIFPNNREKNFPTAPAQVLLMDGHTGIISAILDGTYVTQLRTGAATGVAFDVLAKKSCTIGALFGTGSQAAQQLEAMLAVRDLEEVRIFGRNRERARAFVKRMQEEGIAGTTKLIAVETPDAAIDNADLVITVTSSDTPVFDAKTIKKGCTISAVGSYQYHMQELDPKLLTRAEKIYFDSQDAVLSESGDLLQPLDHGLISEEDFTGNLGDVLLNQLVGREDDEEIIVFKTVGVAPQDLVTAKEIYEKASAAHVGLHWEEA